MTVNTVVGGIQLTTEEPSNVTVLQSTVLDFVEGSRPGQELSRLLYLSKWFLLVALSVLLFPHTQIQHPSPWSFDKPTRKIDNKKETGEWEKKEFQG